MNQREPMGMLKELGETQLVLADPAEDVRGRAVLDNREEEIGTVDELLIDEREHRVRLLRVELGGLPALGGTECLIPVDAITQITDDEVRVNRGGAHVVAAPLYEAGLVDQRYLESVYAHYGYYPYWAPGYVYPSYPVYPD